MENLRIGVAGNIGSGKSTLVAKLSSSPFDQTLLQSLPVIPEQAKVHVFPEQFNPTVLEAFYANPKRTALMAQLEFLNGRLDRQTSIGQAQGIVLEDRTLHEDYHIFGKAQRILNNMSEAEFLAYQRTFNLMAAKIEQPDLMIYLRADVPTLQHRIGQRGRDEEKTIPAEYLQTLNGLYEEFITQHVKCPVIIVNANEEAIDDFYFAKIVNRITEHIQTSGLRLATPGLAEWVSLPESEATHQAIQVERKLREYLQDQHKLITIAGLVGLGKSTFAQIMQGSLNIQGLYENPLENPLLNNFLLDKPKYAYELQLHFLEMRSKQRRLAKSNSHSYVKDRSLPEDYLTFSRSFCRDSILTQNQLDRLCTAFRSRCQELPPADIMVCLQGSPELAWLRIVQRGRKVEVEEGGWTPSEIRKLGEFYRTYARDVVKMGFHTGPILEVNVDRVNILNRIHQGYVFTQVYEKLSGESIRFA